MINFYSAFLDQAFRDASKKASEGTKDRISAIASETLGDPVAHEARMWDLHASIDAAIPPMLFGPGNANNGHPHHLYRVGRECRRVLYVEVIHSYLKTRPGELDRIDAKLRALSQKYEADEFHRDPGEGSDTWRFWWD